jgi:uncharacterized protein DUF3574
VSRLRTLISLLVIASHVGCGTTNVISCKSGEQLSVQELLYFGTEKPSGRVTPEDWVQFLRETVTPRFPDGLTAWQASGQWRSAAGAVIQEPSYVLSLVHPENAAAEKAIQELVASYKARFQQEAVLRVKTYACASL